MKNKIGLYEAKVYTFGTKKEMVDWMVSVGVLPYPNHIVNTNTGRGVGFWSKIVDTYYLTMLTTGNLNVERS